MKPEGEGKSNVKSDDATSTKDSVKPVEESNVNSKPEVSGAKANTSNDSPPFEDVQPDDFVKAMFENTLNKTDDKSSESAKNKETAQHDNSGDKSEGKEETSSHSNDAVKLGNLVKPDGGAESGVARNSSKEATNDGSVKSPTNDP